MKAKLMNIALLGALLLSVVACSDPGSIVGPQERSEVTLSLSVDVPTKAIGDPGSSHLEDSAPWADIVVYFVYDNGTVYPCRVTRAEYDANDSHKFTFTVFNGEGKVYAVAVPDADDVEQQYMAIMSGQDVMRLRTGVPLTGTPDEKKAYMLGCFRSTSDGVPFVITAEGNLQNSVDVTLTRLIAKVDVHYDLQSAYENGHYTQATMSRITFLGLEQGYFFPELNVDALASASLTDVAVLDGSVTERSGRTYFYAFPGVNNEITFSVDYGNTGGGTLSGEQNYKAKFNEPLTSASWHYVRFDVSGTRASADGEITLTSAPAGE